MRWMAWILICLAACETINATLNSTAAPSASGGGHVGTKRGRIAASSGRRSKNGSNRRVRSRLAKSCGGQVGSVLLEEWFRYCQLVFTASVEDIDRERGTVRVTMRRVIRSLVNGTEWTIIGSLATRMKQPPAGQSNSLDPLPDAPVVGPLKQSLVLHGLFDARQNSCVPQFRIRVHDVLLFLVQIHPLNQTLHLVSAPLRITLRNLRLIHTSPESPTGKFLSSVASRASTRRWSLWKGANLPNPQRDWNRSLSNNSLLEKVCEREREGAGHLLHLPDK